MRQQLLAPIEWDTGNKTQPFIEDAVKHKISGYGDRVSNLPHSESIKAIPHLLQHVWEIARQKESRWLNTSDFRQLWGEITDTRVPQYELQKLRKDSELFIRSGIQHGAFGIDGAGEFKLPRFTGSILEVLRPPQNERLAQREQLTAGLLEKLNTLGLLVLRGSTGMGKSTLANSVATMHTGNWRKLDLRGADPEQIKNRLLDVSYLLEGSREQIDCVIDDLNFDQQPHVYENALARLIYAMKLLHGRLIITTQGTLPSRIVSLYDINPISFVDVPVLSNIEVAELVSNHGCPIGAKLDIWSQITFVSTKGHPQLAHAHVKSLEVRGWSRPTADDVTASPGIDEVRREIRHRLREQLSSDKAKTLLYRLSVFTKRFKRSQALYLGNLQPQIEMPGEAFDSLIGPWVEQVDDQQFRLSPLLGNTAREIFSEKELIELHRAAAGSFLALKNIDIFGFEALLTHGFAGRDKTSLVAAAEAVITDENVPWKELSSVASWFGMVKLEQGERLFEEDLLLSTFLRRLQFRIAIEIKPELAIKVAKVWEQEVRQLATSETIKGSSHSSLMMFLYSVTSADQVPFPLETFVNYLFEQYQLFKEFPELLPDNSEKGEALRDSSYMFANPRLFLFLAIKHCRGAVDVIKLLTLLDELSGEYAEEFWELLKNDDNQAMLLINHGWLQETRVAAPNWQEYLELQNTAEIIASKRNAKALMTAIYRVRAIVLKEYCNDREGALRTLDNGERLMGSPQLFLQEYRAKVFFLEDRYNEALTIWNYVLPALEKEKNEGRIFSYRDAAMCAVELGYWSEAADLFRRGAEAAKLELTEYPKGVEYQPDRIIEFCFRAEYAFASWKAGERTTAIKEFAVLTSTFTRPPNAKENLKAHLLYRRIGHAVGWIGLELNGRQNLTEPQPGWFTQQDIGDEIINELSKSPMPPLTQLWCILAIMENRLSIGDSNFKRFEAEFLKSPVPMTTISYYDLLLRHSLKQLKADDLVAGYLRISAEFKMLADQQTEKYSWSEAAELKRVLFVALIRFLCEGQQQAIPMTKWKQEVEKLVHLRGEISEWLSFAEIHLESEVDILRPILKASHADSDHRLLCALLVTTSDEYQPEAEFYANMLLIDSDYLGQWLDVVETDLAALISRKWENIVENQKFALFSPRITCPAILSACQDRSRKGLKKIAAILLAANNAVSTRIDDSVRKKLQQLAD